MTTPRISVVVPCYNASRHIVGTLNSVFAQDWSELEVIVVDDGSTDGSAELVEHGFPRVTVLRQANQGVASARNRGIHHARGDWIAFVDADDIWLPGKLQAQWQCLCREQPSAGMVYSAWRVWASDAIEPSADELESLLVAADSTDKRSGPTGWIYTQLLLDCKVWTSTVLARRTLFDEIGMFDTGLKIGEDYDMWLRASRKTPILRVPRPYALYRTHPASMTKRVPAANYRAIVLERALRKWGLEGPDGLRAKPAEVRRALATSWTDYAWAHLQAGNLRLARDGGRRAMFADWRHAAGWRLAIQAWSRSLLTDGAGRNARDQ